MIFFFLSSSGDVGLGSAIGLRYFSGQFICTNGLTAALRTVSSVSASAIFASAAILAAASEASEWAFGMWLNIDVILSFISFVYLLSVGSCFSISGPDGMSSSGSTTVAPSRWSTLHR